MTQRMADIVREGWVTDVGDVNGVLGLLDQTNTVSSDGKLVIITYAISWETDYLA